MSIMRRMFTLALALCVLSSVTLPALADKWNLSEGNITIEFQTNPDTEAMEQYVTQTDVKHGFDSNPLIFSNTAVTNHTITVDTSDSGGQAAQFTIQNVNIEVDQNTNGIDFRAGSEAVMTVSGENSVDVVMNSGSAGTAAGIHIGDQANVTIQGDGSGDSVLNVNKDGTYHGTQGAGIGTNQGEAFTGSVTFTGDIKVDAHGLYNGAAIGSGNGADFSGDVNITNGADVSADTCQNAAGIGGGQKGNFTSEAEVNIDSAKVEAIGYDNGAGIGGGYKGSFAGTLNITDSEVRAMAGNTGYAASHIGVTSGNAAAIGGGFRGDFTGTVNIQNSDVQATALNRGAGIGTGGNGGENWQGEFSGNVVINNSNVTAESVGKGIPIGAATDAGVFSGSVAVQGNSELNLMQSKNENLDDKPMIGTNDVNSGNASDPDDGGANAPTIIIDDTVKMNVWSGTFNSSDMNSSNRNTYQQAAKGGSYKPLSISQVSMIANGAEVEIIIVPKPAASASSSGTEQENAMFWVNVEAQIRAANKGDTVSVDAGFRNSVPNRIVKLAQECGVTLVIQWNGGEDITITPDAELALEGDPILFETLAALLAK